MKIPKKKINLNKIAQGFFIKVENHILPYEAGDIIILNSQLIHSLYTYESSYFTTILFDLSLIDQLKDEIQFGL